MLPGFFDSFLKIILFRIAQNEFVTSELYSNLFSGMRIFINRNTFSSEVGVLILAYKREDTMYMIL